MTFCSATVQTQDATVKYKNMGLTPVALLEDYTGAEGDLGPWPFALFAI